ncbi:MAG: phosphoribosyltransferase [Burkholderiaceae bacterium]|jgi:putative phosphoribosyl transferase
MRHRAFLLKSRTEAGQLLAARLLATTSPQALVLALPRGGVPVGFEIAQALHLPLDVLVVRKLGVPHHEEFAMGALASGGLMVVTPEVIAAENISQADVADVVRRETQELHRREQLYRGNRPSPALSDRDVILVDDGIATGCTMEVAIAALRARQVHRITVAVPVLSASACEKISLLADALVYLHRPEPFYAVGLAYAAFGQTSDEDVAALLARAAEQASYGMTVQRDQDQTSQ